MMNRIGILGSVSFIAMLQYSAFAFCQDSDCVPLSDPLNQQAEIEGVVVLHNATKESDAVKESDAAKKSATAKKYDFRRSDEFQQLDAATKRKVLQVGKDFDRLQVALNQFMEEHQGQPPKTLDELTPKYLPTLPKDPFAGVKQRESSQKVNKYYQSSLEGKGYLFQRRDGPLVAVTKTAPFRYRSFPGSWRIKSPGLPDFPFQYASKNGRGLIRSHGYFGRLQLDVF